jgi:hypothetical protein
VEVLVMLVVVLVRACMQVVAGRCRAAWVHEVMDNSIHTANLGL